MKINYFLLKQLRNNLTFIFIFFINLFLIIFLFIYYFNQINEFNHRKRQIEEKIKNLENKKLFINLALKLNSDKIDLFALNNRLQSLIPKEEDFFSIINALENLSKETGFIIIDYTINFIDNKSGKVSLVVTGVGSSDSFLNFLKLYKYKGGRLITIDKIDFSPDPSGFSEAKRVNLTFYRQNKLLINNLGTILNSSDNDLMKELLITAPTNLITPQLEEEIQLYRRENILDIFSP